MPKSSIAGEEFSAGRTKKRRVEAADDGAAMNGDVHQDGDKLDSDGALSYDLKTVSLFSCISVI